MINVTLGETFVLRLDATDADGDELTFDVPNIPPGATFNSSGNTMYFIWPVNSSDEVCWWITTLLFQKCRLKLHDIPNIRLILNLMHTFTQNWNLVCKHRLLKLSGGKQGEKITVQCFYNTFLALLMAKLRSYKKCEQGPRNQGGALGALYKW